MYDGKSHGRRRGRSLLLASAGKPFSVRAHSLLEYLHNLLCGSVAAAGHNSSCRGDLGLRECSHLLDNHQSGLPATTNSACSQSHESKRHHALNLSAELCDLESQCEPRTNTWHSPSPTVAPVPESAAVYRLLDFRLRLRRLLVGRRRFLSIPRAPCAATVLRGLIATDPSSVSTASRSCGRGGAV